MPKQVFAVLRVARAPAASRIVSGCLPIALIALLATCSSENVVGPAPSALAFRVQPTSATAGSAIVAVQVEARNASGGFVSTYGDSVTIAITTGTGTTGAALSGTTTKAAVNGVATFPGLSIDKSGANYKLTATARGLSSGTSASFVINPGAATQLAFSVQPTATAAGNAINPAVKVSAQDALGNTATSFMDSVAVTITAGTGAASATLLGTKKVKAVAGEATFPGLSIDKSGTAGAGTGYTFTATALGGLTNAISDPFDIVTGTPARLAFTVQPTSAAAGAHLSPFVEVTVQDGAGNTVTSFPDSVKVAITPLTGTVGAALSGTTTATVANGRLVNGVATFNDLKINSAGTGYTLTATAGVLLPAASTSFTIIPGTATRLVFTVQPANAVDNAPIAAVQVTARDAQGNPATSFNGNVTLAITPGTGAAAAKLSGDTTVAADSGVATFTTLRIDKVGPPSYKLSAAAAGLAGDTSVAFDIVSSTAAKLVFTVPPSSGTAGGTIAPPIKVTVQDISGQTVTSFTNDVTVAITANTGTVGATLSGTTTATVGNGRLVNGVATFNNLKIDSSGTNYTLTASASGVAAAVSGAFSITGGTAVRLFFTVPPSTTTAGATIMPQVEVTARDALGNTATGFASSVKVAIANNTGGGLLSGGDTVAVPAQTGIAAFPNLRIDKAGMLYTLSATAAGLAGDTSAAFDITAAMASQLVFTAPPTTTVAGATIPEVDVTVRDSLGNTVTGFNQKVTLTITAGTSTGGARLSGDTTTAVGGVARFTMLSIDLSGTGYKLSATAGGVAGGTSTAFDITPGAATQLAFTVQPTATTAGTTIATVEVTARDAHGNRDTSFTDTVAVAIGTNAGFGFLSGTTKIKAFQGIAIFSTLRIDKVGTGYTLSATSGSLTPATSAPFDINAGPATHLAFTVQPSTATAGVAITPAVQVTVQDAGGNTVTGFVGSVTLAIGANPSLGNLGGNTTRPVVSGVATFTDLNINKSGIGYTLTSTPGALPVITSAFFNITAGPATQLQFTVPPSAATEGATIAPAVKVTALDALNNPATSFQENVRIAIGTGPGTMSGTRTLAAIDGVATFSTLSIDIAGSYTLTATSGSLTPDTSASFNINLSTATQLFFFVQPTNSTAGATMATIQVSARDVSGQTVASFSDNVTIAITSGTGAAGAHLTGTKTVAAGSGVASFSDLGIDTAAVGYKLTATAPGLPAATSAFFTINPGTASHLVFTLNPSTATAGTVITPRVEVTARDPLSNVATGFTGNVTVAIGTNPASGTLTGTAMVAAVNGIATFSTLSIDHAGSGYTLTAAATGPGGATSATFDVAAERATQLAFTVQPSAATAGTAIVPALEVTARDGTGQTATGFNGSVTLTITGGTGTFGASLSGTTTRTAVNGIATFPGLSINRSGTGFKLSATAAGVSGTTSSAFTINPGAPNRVTFTVPPASTTAGTIIPGTTGPAVLATVRDALGNPVKTFAGTVSVALTANPGGTVLTGSTTVAATNGIATFNDLIIDRSGIGYRMAVSSAGLSADTSVAFAISGGAATHLIFSVQPSAANAAAAITPAIRVTALDSLGNVATSFGGDVTLAIGANPGGGVLSPATPTVGAGNGIAIFTGVSVNQPGIGYTLVATANAVTSATSVSFNIN